MRANANGIILIGLGVLILNLAYTGRLGQVWAAISGGGAPTDGTTGDPQPTPQPGQVGPDGKAVPAGTDPNRPRFVFSAQCPEPGQMLNVETRQCVTPDFSRIVAQPTTGTRTSGGPGGELTAAGQGPPAWRVRG